MLLLVWESTVCWVPIVGLCLCVSMCFHSAMNRLRLWGTYVLECVCTCARVGRVAVCRLQRVWNMCWRSQRNSRALIRTSPGWQLVNSVLRIGVLYSCTKECKLAPMPSGHWERIHMAHTLSLKCALSVALQCNFPQSKEKQAGLMTRPTRTSAVGLCQCAQVCVSLSTCRQQGSYSAMTTKSLAEVLRPRSAQKTAVQPEHLIWKPQES